MSRGLGSLQRQILAMLPEDSHITIAEVVERVHGRHPCNPKACPECASNYESVRRAIAALKRRNEIEKQWWRPERPAWYGRPAVMEKRFEAFVEVMEKVDAARASGVTNPLLSVLRESTQQIATLLSVGLEVKDNR